MGWGYTTLILPDAVKPISLVKWLATLLLPPPEYSPRRILIPFAGVMSEAIGAMFAGWEEIVCIEMERKYCEIGGARMKFWSQYKSYEEAMNAARQIRQDLKRAEQIERLDHKTLSLW